MAKEVIWKDEGFSISYHGEEESYLLTTPTAKISYPRHHHKVMMEKFAKELNQPFVEMEARKIFYPFHHKLSLTNPTLEESLKNAFSMQADTFDVINNPQGAGCGENEYFTRKGPNLQMVLSKDAEKGMQDKMLDFKMRKDGFFRMGDLIGMKLKWKSGNDNIGHGLYRFAGGDINSDFEGDDRGFTFGTGEAVQLDFENGSMSLEHYAKGYGRLAPQQRTYTFNGQEYTSTFYRDEEGKVYQEFLNIEGVKLELRHQLGGGDVYVKVVGKAEKLSDQSGTALKLQESWHQLHEDNGVIQYNNIDHMKDRSRVGAGFSVGKDWTLYESQNFRTQANTEIGGLVSSAGPEDSYVEVKGAISIDSNNYGLGDSRTPAYQASLFGEKRKFGDDLDEQKIGFEVRRNWRVTEKNIFYLDTSVEHSDDRLSNQFGKEELEERGRLDLQYWYGVGWEYRF